MKRHVLGLSAIALVLCAGAAAPCWAQAISAQPAKLAEAKPLHIGDPAPMLKVGKWVKGSEVKSFEKGKVYIVELWATWCGPCKITIPHLTELAHKHKDKVTIIGVSVLERKPEYTQIVDDFVREMGDKMDYTVALDDKPDNSGHTVRNWLEASGQDGIPSAYIINQEGKVAWLGYPTDPAADIDGALDKIINGTWDMKAYAKTFQERRDQEKAAQEKQAAAMKPISDALKAKDYQQAARLFDEQISKNPEMAQQYKWMKFNSLLRGSETVAYATAKDLADNDFKDNAQGLNQLAWTILDPQNNLKTPDYDLALSIAQRAVKASDSKDGMILDTLAYAQFKKGMVDEAIKTQKLALENAGQAPEQTIKEMKDRLEQFKAAKK